MELDFRGCETKEDVRKVFSEKEDELRMLKNVMLPIKSDVKRDHGD